MNGRMESIADRLEPIAENFHLPFLIARFLRSQGQRPHTQNLAGEVDAGIVWPTRWIALGMRRLAKIGEARRG